MKAIQMKPRISTGSDLDGGGVFHEAFFVDRNGLVKERPADLPTLVLSYFVWEENSSER